MYSVWIRDVGGLLWRTIIRVGRADDPEVRATESSKKKHKTKHKNKGARRVCTDARCVCVGKHGGWLHVVVMVVQNQKSRASQLSHPFYPAGRCTLEAACGCCVCTPRHRSPGTPTHGPNVNMGTVSFSPRGFCQVYPVVRRLQHSGSVSIPVSSYGLVR